MTHRYTLERYRGVASRHTCPRCQQKRQFVRYVDNATGLHLGEHVGRCNREVNCAYHYTPKQYFVDNSITNVPRQLPKTKPLKSKAPTAHRISFDLFKRSLQGYAQNHFVCYLRGLFGPSQAQQLVERFYVGTSKHWPGATVFWQIDLEGQVRTGKIMLYDANGKRVKKPFSHIQWVHRHIQQPDFRLEQCLFGLHQLRQAPPNKVIGLVESEKTAVIASGHFPELVWMAVGSLHQLNAERCQVLRGRQLVLFPDVGGWALWQQRAQELERTIGVAVRVSDWLEQQADEAARQQGLDLADVMPG